MLIICRKCSYFQANDQIKRGLFNGDIFLFVNFPVFQTHAQKKMAAMPHAPLPRESQIMIILILITIIEIT